MYIYKYINIHVYAYTHTHKDMHTHRHIKSVRHMKICSHLQVGMLEGLVQDASRAVQDATLGSRHAQLVPAIPCSRYHLLAIATCVHKNSDMCIRHARNVCVYHMLAIATCVYHMLAMCVYMACSQCVCIPHARNSDMCIRHARNVCHARNSDMCIQDIWIYKYTYMQLDILES